jgi:hypothetical protein
MSAIAAITVFDGAASPVSHTLTPISVTRAGTEVEALWREVLATIPAYAQVRATLKLSQSKTGVYRVEVRVVVPVMEAVLNQNAAGYTAAPKVAYENTLFFTGLFHQRSTVTDRRLARQILVNLLGNISTTVSTVNTGPAPELIDQLVAPT